VDGLDTPGKLGGDTSLPGQHRALPIKCEIDHQNAEMAYGIGRRATRRSCSEQRSLSHDQPL
jgi:hypothetical protein